MVLKLMIIKQFTSISSLTIRKIKHKNENMLKNPT